MQAVKTFTVGIEVADPIVFARDAPAATLAILRSGYEGRCYGGVYVLEVLEVLARSATRVVRSNLEAHGVCAVKFTARVRLVAKGDVIVGATVTPEVKAHMGVVMAHSDYGGRFSIIVGGPAAAAVAEGQKISVLVDGAVCQPLKEYVSVAGTVLVPSDELGSVFVLSGVLKKAVAEELAPTADLVKAALRRRAALQKTQADAIRYLEELLYAYRGDFGGAESTAPGGEGYPPWRGPPDLDSPSGAKRVGILALVDDALAGKEPSVAGYWARGPSLHRSAPLVEHASAVPDEWAGQPVVDQSTGAVLQTFLTACLVGLNTVEGELAVYDSEEAIRQHASLWLLRRRSQVKV
jgi:hypothetical protein